MRGPLAASPPGIKEKATAGCTPANERRAQQKRFIDDKHRFTAG